MPVGSPLLDEYDQTGIVRPALKRALDMAGQRMFPPLTNPVGTSPTPSPTPVPTPSGAPSGTPAPSSSAAAPIVSPGAGAAAPAPASSAPTPHQAELTRLTTGNTGKSGIEQIHNPYVRRPLQVLDAIGSAFLPALTMGIPGTALHHQLLVGQAGANVKRDQAAETEAANLAHTNAETAELGPRGEHEHAEAEALAHPRAKDAFELWSSQNPNGTAEDWAQFQEKHRPVSNDFEAWAKQNPGKPVSEWLKLQSQNKPTPEAEAPLGERIPSLNAALLNRYKILNPKATTLPPEYTLPANATQKHFDQVDKLLESTERAAGTKAQQEAAAEARRQTQELAQANRKEHTDLGVRQAAYKAYAPAMDSAERFNVMAKNYEDAVKNHDQQAMLSLLANHLGMTMGLQKGARLNQAVIEEAQKSRPWLQGMKAKFSKDGYLTGVTLTPEQMRQMVDLGRERFTEDIRKSGSEARYMGATDEGPERVPNRSVMNHYIGLANGDAAKAKQLAKDDGWTVK